jgi:hypothetical protein
MVHATFDSATINSTEFLKLPQKGNNHLAQRCPFVGLRWVHRDDQPTATRLNRRRKSHVPKEGLDEESFSRFVLQVNSTRRVATSDSSPGIHPSSPNAYTARVRSNTSPRLTSSRHPETISTPYSDRTLSTKHSNSIASGNPLFKYCGPVNFHNSIVRSKTQPPF